MSKTAAERQRESRQRKRDIVTGENVTCHDRDVPVEPECNAIADIPSPELHRRLHYIRDWKRSPEHIEIMRRLDTQTVEQLEQQGQFVPGWKLQEAAV